MTSATITFFSRYVESHGRQGDCLVALSTSGKSVNILKAAEAAKALGMTVIALTGRSGSPLEALADVCVCAPGGDYADRVQELHIKVLHILIEMVERRFFSRKLPISTHWPSPLPMLQ
ncbi:SIS domain-containing protein [Undibacterium arcticum]